MISQTTQVDDLRLVALPSAVNCAEMFVRFALFEWSLRPLIEEATLVTRHIVKSSIAGATRSRPRFLTVRLRLHGDCVVIELDDDRPGEPPELEGWTISAVSLPDGRRNVWIELPLPTGMTAALPRRSPGRSPVAEISPGSEETSDSQILHRVLYGLNRSANG
ncbi:MAG TPA: hypothetical protein VJT49_28875 [Amycolatopsis sp.]|uniref:hypothetical protein n=1 Tax=Amycolatopsis sp. TaxID=37632 RepID=UPI002B46B5F0|nr:hypothetical protein [Amycolatopsis sp.]HKS49051.1 hypothetical protein [Amycolatopsis sp.]